MRKHTKIIHAIFIILLLFLLSATTVLAYTDQELCDMALQHYSNTKGYTPSKSVIDSASGNSVTIHLYDISGNHTSTYDWYTVDRISGAGENFMGESIDLTPYASTPTASDTTESAEPQNTTEPEAANEPAELEEVAEDTDSDTNITKKSADNDDVEDDSQETDSSLETVDDDSATALAAVRDNTDNNSFTKTILLAIAGISAISGIAGAVILKRAKSASMVLCKNCGVANANHVNFCTQCGKPIESVGVLKKFLLGFKSPIMGCRVGSWVSLLSIIIFLASAISVAVIVPREDNDNDNVQVAAEQAKKESTKIEEPSYEDYLATGREQLAKKDYTQAEESFRKAIELEPKQIEAHQYLIDTYVGQENTIKTADAYKDTIKIINDDYSATGSLLDGSEELYLDAIDFFEAQDDVAYVSQLVEDMLKMTSDQDVIAKLEQKQKEHNQTKRYEAYSQLLADYTATYGEGTVTGQGYNSYLSGCCFAKLMDFNQDGEDELLIAYYDAEKTRGIWVHEIEVWAYDNELLQVYANQSLSDGGMSSFVALSDIGGQPYISTGTLGMPSKVSMWGYTGEQFTEVGSINYDPGVQYIVNGASVAIEECQSALSQWENEITKYWLVSPDQDGNQALTELSNTRSTLQDLTAAAK